jgi:hypothetical protein
MGPSQHILDEAFMTGNVDEADAQVTELEICETEVDGDAASLLFRQPIRIATGQRPHQSALSMIDVTGRADDD